MSIRNKVQLVGNVGKEIKVIAPEGGKKFVTCSIAVDESYKNTKGEKVDKTGWFDLTFFGKTADIAEKFLSKGKKIAVEGKLSNRTYEDKEGNKKYATDIIVNEILMLGGKKEE